jgi:hypothetical protein
MLDEEEFFAMIDSFEEKGFISRSRSSCRWVWEDDQQETEEVDKSEHAFK